MARADFVLFKLARANGKCTHSGRVTIEGLNFSIDAWLVPTHEEKIPGTDQTGTIYEHFEGEIRKADPKQKGLFND